MRSPYEVLAGVSISAGSLWELVLALQETELKYFGRRYSLGTKEIKGTRFLKTKVYHHAQLNADIAPEEQRELAKAALDNGENANIRHLKALALAKLGYVREAFELCRRFGCRAFASIVETDAKDTESDGLRKDYAYLFERFYYYLEDLPGNETGIIVFDELEKTQSHILIEQAHRYFRDTATGRLRANRILPDPFFVHSDLTTGVQIADLIAYVISWGFRTSQMNKPARPELAEFAQQIADMRYRAVRNRDGRSDFTIWSFAHIDDLRTRQERL